MDTAERRRTILGIVILTMWLLLGLVLLFWAVKTSRADHVATLSTGFQEPALFVAQNDEWDPIRLMERMQEEIDRAIRNATEQFRLGPGATVFRPDAGYSSSFDLRDRKDHYELRAYLPDLNASDVNVRIDNEPHCTSA